MQMKRARITSLKSLTCCATTAVLLLVVGVGSHSASGNNSVTASSCQQAWNSSPSVAWCWFEDASVTSDNKCKVVLGCGNGSDRPQVTYTGTIAQIKKLRWCGGGNNGWLKSGNC